MELKELSEICEKEVQNRRFQEQIMALWSQESADVLMKCLYELDNSVNK